MSRRDVTQLCLLRHAHAGDPTRWHGPDAERPLSDRGVRQAAAMGALLDTAGFEPDAVLSSPKLRAAQTARLVGERIGRDVAIEPALGGPLDIDALEALLERAGDPARALLVGHDPDFSDLAAELAGLEFLPLRKGAIVRLDCERPLAEGRAVLRWLVPPDLIETGDGGD